MIRSRAAVCLLDRTLILITVFLPVVAAQSAASRIAAVAPREKALISPTAFNKIGDDLQHGLERAIAQPAALVPAFE